LPELDVKESFHVTVLDRLIDAIHSSDDIIDIFDEAIKQLSQAIKFDHGNILLNNEKARYFCIIQALNQSSERPGEEIIIPYSDTSITEITHSRHSIVRKDLSGRGELTPGDLKFLAEGIKSDLSVPIICKNRLFAVINLSSYESNFFTAYHRAQTEQVASLLGLALERSELVEKLNRKQSDLLFWKNKFNSLNNHIREAVAVVRLDYDLIYETNHAFQKLVGFAAEQLHGMRLSQLHPGEEELILTTLDKCSNSEQDIEIKRLTLNRNDGSQLPVRLRFSAIGGNIIKFAYAWYDEIVKPQSWFGQDAGDSNGLAQLQLAAFNEINRLAIADIDLESFIQSALLAIKRVVDFDYAQLALFDSANNRVEHHTVISDRCRQFDDQKSWHILEQCDFYWYSYDRQDLETETKSGKNSFENIERALQSRASGVLTTRERHPGALVVGSLEPDFYQHHQFEFINQVAEQLAIIIDNAILNKEHQTWQYHCAIQHDLNNRIGSGINIDKVLLNIVKLSSEQMRSQLATVQLLENNGRLARITTSDPECNKNVILKFEADNVLPGLKKSKQPYVIKNIFDGELNLEHLFDEKMCQFTSCMAIAIKSNERTIGFLTNYWKKPLQSRSDDLCLLDAIAAQAAIAIENAMALQETVSYSNRLEQAKDELDNFVEKISCNMKNPLAAIQGFSSTLMDLLKEQINGEAFNFLEKIKKKAVGLQQYIDDLHEFTSAVQRILPFEDIEANEIIERAKLKIFDAIEQKNVKLTVTKEIPMVYGDRNLMQQVFVNLLANALTELGEDNVKPKIEIGYREEIDKDVFYIRNNGIGKRNAYHGNIFDLFHYDDMTENEQSCHKIGLAIAKKIMEIHNGQIWYEMEEGKGSAVFFSLPRKK